MGVSSQVHPLPLSHALPPRWLQFLSCRIHDCALIQLLSSLERHLIVVPGAVHTFLTVYIFDVAYSERPPTIWSRPEEASRCQQNGRKASGATERSSSLGGNAGRCTRRLRGAGRGGMGQIQAFAMRVVGGEKRSKDSAWTTVFVCNSLHARTIALSGSVCQPGRASSRKHRLSMQNTLPSTFRTLMCRPPAWMWSLCLS